MTSKFLFKIMLVLFVALSMANCTKETVNPEQNPHEGYLSATGFNQVTIPYMNSSTFEIGLSFKPLVNGKMTAVIVKIPDTNLNTRVTIWEVATSTILRTELIDITSSDVENTKAISALQLEANKEYMITFNTSDYYIHKKTDNSSVVYPFTVGDISITGYGYNIGTTQQLPTTFGFSNYAGDISFKFQKS